MADFERKTFYHSFIGLRFGKGFTQEDLDMSAKLNVDPQTNFDIFRP